MNFYIYTLGCKINQYETECILQAWKDAHFSYTNDMLTADFLIINSCAVTQNAIKDIIKLLRKLTQHHFQGTLILTGCATQLLDKEAIFFPTIIVPQEKKEKLLQPISLLQEHNILEGVENLEYLEEPFILHSSLKARATIKVHDGCSHRCTYCIIPHMRGPSKSRPLPEILLEIRTLLDLGHREIILSGINLRQFGLDFTLPMDFWDLIKRIEKEFASEWASRARFRISSLEPCQLNEKAIETLAQSTMICPHLHISLQSASDNVLQKMARSHYNVEMLFHAIEQLHQYWNPFALGVDIITGFPGESEQDFQITKQALNDLPITYAHIFPYSERPFTKAPTLPLQIYPHIRKERAKILRSLTLQKQTSFLQYLTEHKVPQYVITEKNNPLLGVSQYYVECRSKEPISAIHPLTPTAYYANYIEV